VALTGLSRQHCFTNDLIREVNDSNMKKMAINDTLPVEVTGGDSA